MSIYLHATLHTDTEDYPLFLEVCATPGKLRQGMMGREEWSPINGMLFVFPTEDAHTMWMQNTPLPLDIVFLDDDQIVVGVEYATKPFSEAAITCAHPSRYVLELPAGAAMNMEVSQGDVLVLEREGTHATA